MNQGKKYKLETNKKLTNKLHNLIIMLIYLVNNLMLMILEHHLFHLNLN